MSKPTTSLLLLPGSHSWELWQDGRCLAETGETLASKVSKTGSGKIVQLFSVRDALALPFVAQTTEEGLLPDLVNLHVERSALLPPIQGGKLLDWKKIEDIVESTAVLAFVLRQQNEESLAKQSPYAFDISPRIYHVEGDLVALWQELGYWVYAVWRSGKLLYFQAFVSNQLDQRAARDLRLSLAQLSMQGLLPESLRFEWWSTLPIPELFEANLGQPMQVAAKPAPQALNEWSELLPADTAAERRRAIKKRQTQLLGVVFGLVVVGLVGMSVMKWYRTHQALKLVVKELAANQEDAELAIQTIEKTNELEPMFNASRWPARIMLEAQSCLPEGQMVRFASFQIEPDEASRPARLVIKGQARNANDLQSINYLQSKLTSNRRLKEYQWQLPPPQANPQGLMQFDWSAILQGTELK